MSDPVASSPVRSAESATGPDGRPESDEVTRGEALPDEAIADEAIERPVQLDAIRMQEMLRRRLASAVDSENYLRHREVAETLERMWRGPADAGGLVGELWLQASQPSKASEHSLRTLSEADRFDPAMAAHLDAAGAIPRDRPLYTHQADAVLAALGGLEGQSPAVREGTDQPAVVVSAGTGTGKTEAFLLPLLNRLCRTPRTGRAERGGMRALILYPMNALVNDQVERLDGWLRTVGSGRTASSVPLTMFHFTSETPEEPKRSAPISPAHRVMSRQEARGMRGPDPSRKKAGIRQHAPDIVVTNYSMLEYMLCRPQDACFFDSSLDVIVLDEAHLYGGTLAGEIALLLRRVLNRCGRSADQVLQLATTATLGGDDDAIRRFAGRLFSKPSADVTLLKGEPASWPNMASEPDETPPRINLEPLAAAEAVRTLEQSGDAKRLAEDAAGCEALRTALAAIVGPKRLDACGSETRPARLLHAALAGSPILRRLQTLAQDAKPHAIADLAGELWPKQAFEEVGRNNAVQATSSLLWMAAAARQEVDAIPLLPHRLHLQVSSVDGVSICLATDCSGPSALKALGIGAVQPRAPRCRHCESATAFVVRCDHCGQLSLLTDEPTYERVAAFRGRDDDEDEDRVGDDALTLLTPAATIDAAIGAAIGDRSDVVAYRVDPETGRTRSDTDRTASLLKVIEHGGSCLRCGSGRDAWRPVQLGDAFALQIVAETAHVAQPVFPSVRRQWLPAGGRRMIAFSDSRRDAARLGPGLTERHDTQLTRALLSQVVGQDETVGDDRKEMIEEVASLRGQLESGPLPEFKRRTLIETIEDYERQLLIGQQGRPLSDWIERLCGWPEAKRPRVGEYLADGRSGDSGRRFDYAAITEWSQDDWERNLNAAREVVSLRVRQEIAYRYANSASAESVGVVEVGYPGLSEAVEQHRSRVGGVLSTNRGRELFEENWTTILELLCDCLRADGCSTLGTAEEDFTYSSNLARVGYWAVIDAVSGRDHRLRTVPFIGRQWSRPSRRNRFVADLLAAAGEPEPTRHEVAERVLRIAFEALAAAAEGLDWIETKQTQTGPDAASDAIRISAPGLTLRRPQTLYQCGVTGLLWPRQVDGIVPHVGCGEVETVDRDRLDRDSRWSRQRREFLGRGSVPGVLSVGLWAFEHTAQIGPEENRRLQTLFKNGAANLLSSTTTLELGIDIGGLAGVLLANVPPGKANYLQRAGRAGRRADGSSAVVTFARRRPFDQEVFSAFGDYLRKPLPEPTVILNRQRLVQRHVNAVLLSAFFSLLKREKTGAMDAFGHMASFMGEPIVTKRWDKGDPPPEPSVRNATPTLPSLTPRECFGSGVATAAAAGDSGRAKPAYLSPQRSLAGGFLAFLRSEAIVDDKELATAIRETVAGTPLANDRLGEPGDAGRAATLRLFGQTADCFERLCGQWRQDVAELTRRHVAIASADGDHDAETNDRTEDDRRRQANAIMHQTRVLAEVTTIEALANHQFLPRYGFPIGVHRLRVEVPELDESGQQRVGMTGRLKTREEDRYRLDRSGMQAIREYVPGAVVTVGGRDVVSRGLLRHWTNAGDNLAGHTARRFVCDQGHGRILGEGEPVPTECEEPGCTQTPRWQELFFPRFGYVTAAWEPPRPAGQGTGIYTEPEAITDAFATETAVSAAAAAESSEIAAGPSNSQTAAADGRGAADVRPKPLADGSPITVRLCEGGELVAVNSGANGEGFSICLGCGFADSEPRRSGRAPTPRSSEADDDDRAGGASVRFANHSPLHFSRSSAATHCLAMEGTPQPRRHQHLAARERTDLVEVDFAAALRGLGAEDRPKAVVSAMHALRIGGCELLGLDTREIGGFVASQAGGSRVVLHDTSPGGAGHVLELADRRGREWIAAAIAVTERDETHQRSCRTACQRCLLTFASQRDRSLLDRTAAKRLLAAAGPTDSAATTAEPTSSGEPDRSPMSGGEAVGVPLATLPGHIGDEDGPLVRLDSADADKLGLPTLIRLTEIGQDEIERETVRSDSGSQPFPSAGSPIDDLAAWLRAAGDDPIVISHPDLSLSAAAGQGKKPTAAIGRVRAASVRTAHDGSRKLTLRVHGDSLARLDLSEATRPALRLWTVAAIE